jgi:hypothetical protein
VPARTGRRLIDRFVDYGLHSSITQDQRIRTLESTDRRKEARLQAMGRYMHVLKGTIRDLGGSVPGPAPLDAHLID